MGEKERRKPGKSESPCTQLAGCPWGQCSASMGPPEQPRISPSRSYVVCPAASHMLLTRSGWSSRPRFSQNTPITPSPPTVLLWPIPERVHQNHRSDLCLPHPLGHMATPSRCPTEMPTPQRPLQGVCRGAEVSSSQRQCAALSSQQAQGPSFASDPKLNNALGRYLHRW